MKVNFNTAYTQVPNISVLQRLIDEDRQVSVVLTGNITGTGALVIPATINIKDFINGAMFTGYDSVTIGKMSYDGLNQISDGVDLYFGLARSAGIQRNGSAVKWMRPEWFGAVADGNEYVMTGCVATDSYPAIQRDIYCARMSNAILKLNTGVYEIKQGLKCDDDSWDFSGRGDLSENTYDHPLIIEGSGMRTSSIQPWYDNSTGHFTKIDKMFEWPNTRACKNTEFRDFGIIGEQTDTNHGGQYGLYGTNVNLCKFVRLLISGFQVDCVNFSLLCYTQIYDSCWISSGIHAGIVNQNNANAIDIVNCWIFGNGIGVLLGNGYSARIVGGEFENNNIGILAYGIYGLEIKTYFEMRSATGWTPNVGGATFYPCIILNGANDAGISNVDPCRSVSIHESTFSCADLPNSCAIFASSVLGLRMFGNASTGGKKVPLITYPNIVSTGWYSDTRDVFIQGNRLFGLDASGKATIGSAEITEMTSADAFKVGELVTISNGFDSEEHVIQSKTSTSITIDMVALSTHSGVTITATQRGEIEFYEDYAIGKPSNQGLATWECVPANIDSTNISVKKNYIPDMFSWWGYAPQGLDGYIQKGSFNFRGFQTVRIGSNSRSGNSYGVSIHLDKFPELAGKPVYMGCWVKQTTDQMGFRMYIDWAGIGPGFDRPDSYSAHTDWEWVEYSATMPLSGVVYFGFGCFGGGNLDFAEIACPVIALVGVPANTFYREGLKDFLYGTELPFVFEAGEVPTAGTWKKGDRIISTDMTYNGGIAEYLSSVNGTFKTMTGTGNTVSGSKKIRCIENTKDFYEGGLINLSAGFADLTLREIDSIDVTVSSATGVTTLGSRTVGIADTSEYYVGQEVSVYPGFAGGYKTIKSIIPSTSITFEDDDDAATSNETTAVITARIASNITLVGDAANSSRTGITLTREPYTGDLVGGSNVIINMNYTDGIEIGEYLSIPTSKLSGVVHKVLSKTEDTVTIQEVPDGNDVGVAIGFNAPVFDTIGNTMKNLTLSGDLTLGNQFQAGTITETGYLVLYDKTGTAYKVLATPV